GLPVLAGSARGVGRRRQRRRGRGRGCPGRLGPQRARVGVRRSVRRSDRRRPLVAGDRHALRVVRCPRRVAAGRADRPPRRGPDRARSARPRGDGRGNSPRPTVGRADLAQDRRPRARRLRPRFHRGREPARRAGRRHQHRRGRRQCSGLRRRARRLLDRPRRRGRTERSPGRAPNAQPHRGPRRRLGQGRALLHRLFRHGVARARPARTRRAIRGGRRRLPVGRGAGRGYGGRCRLSPERAGRARPLPGRAGCSFGSVGGDGPPLGRGGRVHLRHPSGRDPDAVVRDPCHLHHGDHLSGPIWAGLGSDDSGHSRACRIRHRRRV
ncbi:MAG: hypothetical protein AVDCRST_MAG73-889, partial [uncultured Thermomicrobiales bacterium]